MQRPRVQTIHVPLYNSIWCLVSCVGCTVPTWLLLISFTLSRCPRRQPSVERRFQCLVAITLTPYLVLPQQCRVRGHNKDSWALDQQTTDDLRGPTTFLSACVSTRMPFYVVYWLPRRFGSVPARSVRRLLCRVRRSAVDAGTRAQKRSAIQPAKPKRLLCGVTSLCGITSPFVRFSRTGTY